MPWYKTGTVSVVQNSNAVTGTGTAFISNSRVGDAFRGPDGGWYEVTNIASDTAMSIAPPYLGVTASAGSYALAPMQGYVKDSADALRALVNQFGGVLSVLGSDPTLAGVRDALNLESTDGLTEGATNKYFTEARVRAAALTGFTVPGTPAAVVATDSILAAFGKLQAQVAARAAKGDNSDITSLNGLTTPLSLAQGGLGGAQGFIEGLTMTWSSATSVAIGAGSAYVPSVNKIVSYAGGTLTPSGVANSFIHLYLTSAGAIEQSSTAPARYYNQAHVKTSDISRRYIGSMLVRATANQVYKFEHHPLDSSVVYKHADPQTAPFILLNAASGAASFSCRPCTPSTAHTLEAAWQNPGTASTYAQFTPSDAGTSITTGWSVFVLAGIVQNARCAIATDGTITYQANGGAKASVYCIGYYFDR
ncbi:hypothetical protein [Pseudomonas sp. R16(2017)]|uniref:hypothetical protein n=1 Tax=Pseudomonas sp. R16(2017) TaxID=1981704 RepID=UPI0021147DE4|nr:hypothetical protein [Pseudomonas sp. R16(2017)]